MVYLRRGNERGSADHGWLQARHSFSFSDYYDSAHMGVSALRVINDDRIQPGKGFATHSHSDMEIITYVKTGMIEHQDSMGNTEQISAGEFQLMSAGSGITHSEVNPSNSEPLSLLQIWIEPNEMGVTPVYEQKTFVRAPGLSLIASADGRDGSLRMHQDASLYRIILNSDQQETYTLSAGRTAYLHVVSGELKVNGHLLGEADAIGLSEVSELPIQITAQATAEALLFDLP